MPRGQKAQPGDETVNANGYTFVKQEDGTWKNKRDIIAEEILGRPLGENERVKNKDGNPRNLNRSNIEITIVLDKRSPEARLKVLEAEIIDLEDKLVFLQEEKVRLYNEIAEAAKSSAIA